MENLNVRVTLLNHSIVCTMSGRVTDLQYIDEARKDESLKVLKLADPLNFSNWLWRIMPVLVLKIEFLLF